MALHFALADHGLEETHKSQCRRSRGWLLDQGNSDGLECRYATNNSEAAIAMRAGVLTGDVVLSVLKGIEYGSHLREEAAALRRTAGAPGCATLLLVL